MVGVLADYGRIVPPAILALPRRGILNVHPSLLPRWRGAAPIQATIAAGDTEAGVTLIAMDAGLDSGPIVAVERWALSGSETAPELESRAAEAGAALVRRDAGSLAQGRDRAHPAGRRRGHDDEAAPPRRRTARAGQAGGRARAPGPGVPAVAGQLPRDTGRTDHRLDGGGSGRAGRGRSRDDRGRRRRTGPGVRRRSPAAPRGPAGGWAEDVGRGPCVEAGPSSSGRGSRRRPDAGRRTPCENPTDERDRASPGRRRERSGDPAWTAPGRGCRASRRTSS